MGTQKVFQTSSCPESNMSMMHVLNNSHATSIKRKRKQPELNARNVIEADLYIHYTISQRTTIKPSHEIGRTLYKIILKKQ